MRYLLRLSLCCAFFALTIPQAEREGAIVQAASNCHCEGIAFGHTYSGTFVGSQSGSMNQLASSNVQCAASICQPWAWTLGNAVCNTYGLNGSGAGSGYVVIDWDWSYLSWHGNLVQQYDCDDI